jgi:tetratricopeptide (TPR) repeat protein
MTKIEDQANAEILLTKAISIWPSSEYHYRRGYARFSLATNARSSLDGAMTDFKAAVDNSPYHHKYRLSYGQGLIIMGNVNAGRLQLEEAVRLYPKSESAKKQIEQLLNR